MTQSTAQTPLSSPVFVPFCDSMFDAKELPGVLVPFHRDFTCVRLADGTYDFTGESTEHAPLETA